MNRFEFYQSPAHSFFRFMFSCTPQAEALCAKAAREANLPTKINLPEGYEEFSNYPNGWIDAPPGTKVSLHEKETVWVKSQSSFYHGLKFRGEKVGIVCQWLIDEKGEGRPSFEPPTENLRFFNGPKMIQISDWPELQIMLPGRFAGLFAAELDPSIFAELKSSGLDLRKYLWPAYTEVLYGTKQEVKANRERLRKWLEEEAASERKGS